MKTTKTIDDFDLKKFWIDLWNLLSFTKKEIKKLLVMIIITELLFFIGPYLFKKIVDVIAKFSVENLDELIWLIAVMFLASQFTSIVLYFTDKMIFKIIAESERYLPVFAQQKMVSLSLSYHERENTGNKISKIQRGTDKVIMLLADMCWQVAPTLVQIILTAIILFIFDWRFGLIFIFFVPLFIILTLRLNKQVTPARKIRHDKYEESNGQMTQSIININTVKSFVQENRETKTFSDMRADIKKNALLEFYGILKFNLGRNLVIDTGRVLMLAFGVYLVWQNLITIGSLIFIFTISEKAFLSLYRISKLYDRIMDSSEAVTRLDELTKEESEIINKENGIKPKKIIGQIVFKNLDFAYEGSGKKSLNNINVKINSDCITALVGPSGGGKTTLARMIYRHYDPTKGEILLDDKNLKDYDLFSFRKHIAIVPQDVEVFNESVRNNIAYAKPKASTEEIIAAAKIANAHEFIDQLSEKYDTLVGERGVKLSGGQRQRVGIARAILANPSILIFDEATSNLDSYSEKLIQDAMSKVSKNKTVIIIAHRLSTIKKADKIIVLENGKVVEEGSHFELSKKNGGLYSKLLKLQELGEVD